MPSAGLKRELFTEGLILYNQLLKFCLLALHTELVSLRSAGQDKQLVKASSLHE